MRYALMVVWVAVLVTEAKNAWQSFFNLNVTFPALTKTKKPRRAPGLAFTAKDYFRRSNVF